MMRKEPRSYFREILGVNSLWTKLIMDPLPVPVDGDRNRGSALLAALWVPFPFTVALLSARFFVRLKFRNVGSDDYTMFASWVSDLFMIWIDTLILNEVLYTIAIALSSFSMIHGGARHLYFLKPEILVTVLRYNFLSQPFHAMSQALGKNSVGFLILRIIGPNTLWRKWFIYVNLALYMLTTIVTIALIFSQCSPARGLWDHSLKPNCWDRKINADVAVLQSCRLAHVTRHWCEKCWLWCSIWHVLGFCTCTSAHYDYLELANELPQEDSHLHFLRPWYIVSQH